MTNSGSVMTNNNSKGNPINEDQFDKLLKLKKDHCAMQVANISDAQKLETFANESMVNIPVSFSTYLLTND